MTYPDMDRGFVELDSMKLLSNEEFVHAVMKSQNRRFATKMKNFKVYRYFIVFTIIVIALILLVFAHFTIKVIESNTNEFIKFHFKNNPTIPSKFTWPSEVKPIECNRLFQNDQQYLATQTQQQFLEENMPKLDMSCEAIRKRNYFPSNPLTKEEANFPLAYAKDYRFLEMEFAAEYAPQNFYCFSIDKKSPKRFHENLQALASCFPKNVFIAQHEYYVDAAGHNMGYAHYECFKELAKPGRPWKYNHDVLLKTNQQLVQILTWLNDANDVEVYQLMPARVDLSKNWTFEALRLFKNNSRNLHSKHSIQPPKLDLAKGLVESSLSRAAVDFMLKELDLTGLFEQIETDRYGVDEIILPSLQASDELGLPGGFTNECQRRNIDAVSATRFTIWLGDDTKTCHKWRHYSCVLGMHSLAEFMLNLPHLFANKFMPEYDFGASICWHQLMYNRTYLTQNTSLLLDPKIYKNLPHVRFQTLKQKSKTGFVDLEKFDCDYKLYPFHH